jgi:putative ABC transport system ATP-binding protein
MTGSVVDVAPTDPGIVAVQSPAPPLVQWEKVTKDDGTGALPALAPTDLNVETGSYVALIGPSGSGKSTVCNVLGLLERPSSGRYLLGGLDVDHLDDDARATQSAQSFGLVFQDVLLLQHRTVCENVELGLLYAGVRSVERRDRAIDLLGRVGLSDRIEADPGTLSGGERQRVAIARAMMRAPKMLLCDEPTGKLNSVDSREVLDLLGALHAHGTAVFVASHDHTVGAGASRTLEIRDGVIASYGIAAERR